MRLGIQINHEIVQGAHDGTLAGRQLVQLGIFQIEIPLSHGALHVSDGVAHHAAQSGLSFGAMHDLFDRSIHHAGIQHCRIVAAAAPFRRLCADSVLHVFNGLAIPLVIERREMVSRAEPLLVNVLMAALARV